jgi:hypothetical protein
MKQVLLTLGLLLVVMFGFYLVSNRYSIKEEITPVVTDKQIYFVTPKDLTSGTETEIQLMAKHETGRIVSYQVDFTYDPAAIKIVNIEVNKDIFDKKASSNINEDFGKVEIIGENSKNRDALVSGETLLATIKIKGLKKGATMIYASRKPETGVLDTGKVTEGNFQMPNFKVNFL